MTKVFVDERHHIIRYCLSYTFHRWFLTKQPSIRLFWVMDFCIVHISTGLALRLDKHRRKSFLYGTPISSMFHWCQNICSKRTHRENFCDVKHIYITNIPLDRLCSYLYIWRRRTIGNLSIGHFSFDTANDLKFKSPTLRSQKFMQSHSVIWWQRCSQLSVFLSELSINISFIQSHIDCRCDGHIRPLDMTFHFVVINNDALSTHT